MLSDEDVLLHAGFLEMLDQACFSVSFEGIAINGQWPPMPPLNSYTDISQTILLVKGKTHSHKGQLKWFSNEKMSCNFFT